MFEFSGPVRVPLQRFVILRKGENMRWNEVDFKYIKPSGRKTTIVATHKESGISVRGASMYETELKDSLIFQLELAVERENN